MSSLTVILALVVCVVSFVPAFLDHNETLHSFRKSTGKNRVKLGLKLFLVLWGIPLLAFVSAIVAGFSTYDSDKKIERLESKLRPRSITPKQRTDFIAALKTSPKGHVTVFTINSSREINEYGLRIREMIQRSGFDTGKLEEGWTPRVPPEGVSIGFQDLGNPMLASLQDGFGLVRIDVVAVRDPHAKTNELTILVGAKP